jgi:UDP-N-acetylmuramoyl-L-alanyl-D-glutamate--2,6-diaminopimelate ligase
MINISGYSLLELSEHLKAKGLLVKCTLESPNAAPKALQTNSREVGSDDVFLAYQGVGQDSHKFLKDGKLKPMCVVVEPHYDGPAFPNCLMVKDGRSAWSEICSKLAGQPNEKLRFIGVTGTNGKTSTTWYTYHLLRAAGHKVLYIGTLGVYLGEDYYPSMHTTPDPPVFFDWLRRAVEQNVSWVIMEVSSQAIFHRRVAPISFELGCFTSFSQDHLDLHKTLEDYWACKLSFILAPNMRRAYIHQSLREQLSSPSSSMEFYGEHRPELPSTDHPYSTITLDNFGEAGVCSVKIQHAQKGLSLIGNAPVPVSFLRENFLAAVLLASAVDPKCLDTGLWQLVPFIPGRCEFVSVENRPNAPRVVIDYAHSPDGIEKILEAARPLCSGEVWIVFGCGGDRDRSKRSLMAKAAQRADHVIITNDNPRTESPSEILDEIAAGFSDETSVRRIENRRQAIVKAISLARATDLVIIAGKGHEDYQEIDGRRIDFSDREIALEALK